MRKACSPCQGTRGETRGDATRFVVDLEFDKVQEGEQAQGINVRRCNNWRNHDECSHGYLKFDLFITEEATKNLIFEMKRESDGSTR